MRNPYKKLLSKIKSSHDVAPTRITVRKDGTYDEEKFKKRMEEAKNNPVLITEKDLEEQYEKQNGCDYWFSTQGIYIPLDLMDVFNEEGWYPWAPSVDKLEPELGYVPGNFCLTFRFLNFGRCKYSGSMEQVMNTFINMCKNENSKPNSTLLEFIK